jgi:hypothetical protein
MAKGDLKDRVLDDARNKALKMTHIPDSISKVYNVEIKSGKIAIKKKHTKGTNTSHK